MDVSFEVSPDVAVSQVKRGATCLTIENGALTLYLHGNCTLFRALAEAILMAVPPPMDAYTRREVSQDGTEVLLLDTRGPKQ